MRKKYFIMTLMATSVLSIDTFADDSGTCGLGCSWVKNGSKLVITAEDGAVMDDFEELDDGNKCYTNAPWGTDFSEVEFIGGLTNISSNAFQGSLLQTVTIPDTVTSIGINAFSWTDNLASITIPDSVTSIGKWAFARVGDLTSIIIPNSVKNIGDQAFAASTNLEAVIIESPNTVLSYNSLVRFQGNIYCQSIEQCLSKGIENEKINIYTKQSGVYHLENGTMFASPNDMMSGTNACTDLDTCKATVLQNKGYCTGEVCAAMVMAENGNHPIEYNNKSYASIDDLLKGKYMPKRIYTIDEANKVAGKTNRVSITYR